MNGSPSNASGTRVRRPKRTVLVPVLLGLSIVSACRTGRNYVNPVAPRYSGIEASSAVPTSSGRDTLRLVSFNVEFARNIDSAIAVLVSEPSLRDADVLLLQEMDESGTRRIAQSLGLSFVYYPAMLSLRSGRDFGNAVLSRWPITGDAKILLPHAAFITGIRRIATAATIRVGESNVRIYSAHFGTLLEVTPGGRRDQLRTILEDAASWDYAVVAGDFNNGGVARMATSHAFAWPTEHGPRTSPLGRWDHILIKGLHPVGNSSAGTVTDTRDASDHRPVWAIVVLEHDAT